MGFPKSVAVMSAEEVFLRDIRERPEDDAPRLIYADWLEEHGPPGGADRAAFIRLQCRAAALPAEDDDRPELERQARLLLRQHRDSWLGALGELIHDAQFRRGFVEGVEVLGKTFLERPAELFEREPIRHVTLLDVNDSRLLWLTGCPFLDRIEGLVVQPPHSLFGVPVRDHVRTDEIVEELARSPHLRGLRSLDLTDNHFRRRGVAALASSPHLGGLERLVLSSAGLDGEGVLALAASTALAGLTALDLSGNNLGSDAMAALVRTTELPYLRKLRWSRNRLGDADLNLLARSPLLERLSDLDLSMVALGESIAPHLQGAPAFWPSLVALLQSPYASRLTAIGLGYMRAGDALGAVLANAAPLAGLTSLRLANTSLQSAGLRALVQSPHLGHLRVLELNRNNLDDFDGQTLASWDALDGLTALELADNSLGSKGAQATAASRHLRHLRLLDLGNNGIGVAGARALAESPHLTGLTDLRLNWNDLEDEGVAILAGSPALRCLAALNLKGNRIGNAGARALIDSPYLGALDRLELQSNRMDARRRRALRERFGERVCFF
jgi:uncharacterized protein (TIGR02996 family)